MAMKKVTVTITFECDDVKNVSVMTDRGEEVMTSREVLDEVTEAMFVQLEGLTDDYGIEYDNAKVDLKIT